MFDDTRSTEEVVEDLVEKSPIYKIVSVFPECAPPTPPLPSFPPTCASPYLTTTTLPASAAAAPCTYGVLAASGKKAML